jgi:hypothetical protein
MCGRPVSSGNSRLAAASTTQRGTVVTDRHKRAGDDRHNGATFWVGKTDIPVDQKWVDFEPFASRAEAAAGATLGLRRDLPSSSMQ